MPLIITDEQLESLHMDEQTARVEIACRLFDADVVSKTAASRLAGLGRIEFEQELIKRGLPIIHYTEGMLEEDLAAVREFRASRQPQDSVARKH